MILKVKSFLYSPLKKSPLNMVKLHCSANDVRVRESRRVKTVKASKNADFYFVARRRFELPTSGL
jgi:hypothetical protein